MQATTARCDDWPQFRGPGRDGKSLEKNLLKVWPKEGLQPLWVIEGLGSTVGVEAGRVNVGRSRGISHDRLGRARPTEQDRENEDVEAGSNVREEHR